MFDSGVIWLEEIGCKSLRTSDMTNISLKKLRTDVDQKVDCMFTTRNKGYAIRGEVMLRFTAGSFHNLQRNIKL